MHLVLNFAPGSVFNREGRHCLVKCRSEKLLLVYQSSHVWFVGYWGNLDHIPVKHSSTPSKMVTLVDRYGFSGDVCALADSISHSLEKAWVYGLGGGGVLENATNTLQQVHYPLPVHSVAC